MLLTACRTAKPGSASFASVVIPNRTPKEIELATRRVFEQDGYKAYAGRPGELVFERQARNGLYGTEQGQPVWVRVRTTTVQVKPDSYLLECQAFMFLNKGSEYFEEDEPLSKARSGPYQRLLDKVQTILK